MTRIYLAGPLFCQAERDYNSKIKAELTDAGFDVVLPQDSEPLFEPTEMGNTEYAKESARKVFEKDLRLLDGCDVLVFNLDGRVPDEGACVELGYAFAKGKRVYGLKTDIRVAEFGIDNMMISGMLGNKTAHSVGELVSMIGNGKTFFYPCCR